MAFWLKHAQAVGHLLKPGPTSLNLNSQRSITPSLAMVWTVLATVGQCCWHATRWLARYCNLRFAAADVPRQPGAGRS